MTGVIPRFMVEQNWHHTGLSELIKVDTMHDRKQKMAVLSDAIIALPGGYGTLEELLEVITWKQLGLYLNPIVILNVKDYYGPLLEMFARAAEEHFIGARHMDIWRIAHTPEEAVTQIQTTPIWDVSFRKFTTL